MRVWLAKHWAAVFGGVAALAPLWTGFKWLLDWGGRFDVLGGWGAQIVKAAAAVPPWMNIVLLLIGLSAIWWDLKRTASAGSRPQPAAQADVHLAALENVVPAARQAPATTHPHDVPKKLAVIDEQIMPLLRSESEIDLHVLHGRQLLNKWKQAIASDRPLYLDELREYRTASSNILDRLKKLQHSNSHFEDIALLLEFENSPHINGTYPQGLEDFCAGIGALGGPPYGMDLDFFMTPRTQMFSSGLENFRSWRSMSEGRFTELRKRIASGSV